MIDAIQARLVCESCGAIYRTDFESCALDGHPLRPLTEDPLIGRTIADRYNIEECVSEGAMGRVYLATHTRMSKRFALKILFGEHASQKRTRLRFKREAEAASRLEHPNLVSVVDFGETPSRLLYLVMDYIEGDTLGSIIAQEGPLEQFRALRLVREIARGLRHLHSRELVHRDLKLDNVIVTKDGDVEVPKIVDLGVAFLPPTGTDEEKLTKQGTIVGTPAFMAPEQAFGDEVDPRSDIFSLGMVLYHLLAGRGPFEGTAVEVIKQNVTDPFPPIEERNPDAHVSPDVQKFLDRMIEKHAADRYESAQEVIDAIDRVRQPSLAPAAVATYSSLRAEVAEPPPSSGKRRALVGAAIGVLLAGIGLGGWALTKDEVPAEPEPQSLAEMVELEDELESRSKEPQNSPTRKVRRRRARQQKKKAASERPEVAAAEAAPAFAPLQKTAAAKTRVAPSVASLTELSGECAELIQRIEDRHGSVAAGPFRVRHLGIATPTASTPPEELHQIGRQLARLQSTLEKRL